MNKRCCRDIRENKKPLYFYKVKVISEAETIKCYPEFSVSKQYVYFQASIFYLGNTLPCQSTVAIFERKRKQINYLLFCCCCSKHRKYTNKVLGRSSLWSCLNHLEAIFIKDTSEDTSLNPKMQLWCFCHSLTFCLFKARFPTSALLAFLVMRCPCLHSLDIRYHPTFYNANCLQTLPDILRGQSQPQLKTAALKASANLVAILRNLTCSLGGEIEHPLDSWGNRKD